MPDYKYYTTVYRETTVYWETLMSLNFGKSRLQPFQQNTLRQNAKDRSALHTVN